MNNWGKRSNAISTQLTRAAGAASQASRQAGKSWRFGDDESDNSGAAALSRVA